MRPFLRRLLRELFFKVIIKTLSALISYFSFLVTTLAPFSHCWMNFIQNREFCYFISRTPLTVYLYSYIYNFEVTSVGNLLRSKMRRDVSGLPRRGLHHGLGFPFSRIDLYCVVSSIQDDQGVVHWHQTHGTNEVFSHQRSQDWTMMEVPQTPDHPVVGVTDNHISIYVEGHAGHVQPEAGLQARAETVGLIEKLEVSCKHAQSGVMVPLWWITDVLHYGCVPCGPATSHRFWMLEVWNDRLIPQEESTAIIHFHLG